MATYRFLAVAAFLSLTVASSLSCSSNRDNACTPGQSIRCVGVTGCTGAQVCTGEGSGYGECTCGSPGYQVGTGGNASTQLGGAVGGTFGSALGGSSSVNGGTQSCVPESVSGRVFPAYIPARHMPGSCTEQAILDYYVTCYQSGECAAFMTGGPYATCGACLAPSELTASSLGPLLQLGPGSAYAIETNVAGCEEILGEVACAPKMQAEFLCQYAACTSNCPLDNYDSYNALYQCMATALTMQCASQHKSAQCLQLASDAAPCTGSNFQEQFIAVSKTFCS